jgi:hypothetical protein
MRMKMRQRKLTKNRATTNDEYIKRNTNELDMFC